MSCSIFSLFETAAMAYLYQRPIYIVELTEHVNVSTKWRQV